MADNTTTVHVTLSVGDKQSRITLKVPTDNAEDALQWVTTKLTERYPFSVGHN